MAVDMVGIRKWQDDARSPGVAIAEDLEPPCSANHVQLAASMCTRAREKRRMALNFLSLDISAWSTFA